MSTLLIVDDENWARETVKELIDLDSLGITKVVEATNGAEAIECIMSAQPDVLLTDMKMPGIDGISLLEVLAKEYPNISAIVLSGYQDFVYTRQAIKSKVIEYLPKPVDETELNEALKKAIFEKRKKQQQQISYHLFTVKKPEVEAMIEPFRRTVEYALKELNAAQFSTSILQLIENIDDKVKQDQSLILHLHQIFLLLLEEAMKEHKLKAEDIDIDWNQLTYQTNRSLSDELINQKKMGEQFIVKIEEIKKQKLKINLNDIKQFLEEYFNSATISLELVSKKFFVSKEYLTTIFKKSYGCNVTEYIISLRMKKAKELVTTTTLQFKTISEMVGYEDVSYFYRVFKKFYGKSPGEIRKS
jgi:two-component system, response regulator YesN